MQMGNRGHSYTAASSAIMRVSRHCNFFSNTDAVFLKCFVIYRDRKTDFLNHVLNIKTRVTNKFAMNSMTRQLSFAKLTKSEALRKDLARYINIFSIFSIPLIKTEKRDRSEKLKQE